MTVAKIILLDVVVHLRTRFVEWVFAAILCVFAQRLLGAGDTFTSSPSYSYMESWMSECHWGYTLGIVSWLRLIALGINGSLHFLKHITPAIRALTAYLSSAAWFCLAYGFYSSNPNATGWGTYGVIFVADFCLAITIAHEAGHAYRMRDAAPRKH